MADQKLKFLKVKIFIKFCKFFFNYCLYKSDAEFLKLKIVN